MHFKLILRLHIFCEKVLVAYCTCHYVDRELLTPPTLHHRTDKAWLLPAGWMSFTCELPGRNDRWTLIFMFRSASTLHAIKLAKELVSVVIIHFYLAWLSEVTIVEDLVIVGSNIGEVYEYNAWLSNWFKYNVGKGVVSEFFLTS